jgi:hypothetical protein
VLGWAACTVTLIVSLGLTACTDPGIVRRTLDKPTAPVRRKSARGRAPVGAWGGG